MIFVKFLGPASGTSRCHLAHSKSALAGGGNFPFSLLLLLNAAFSLPSHGETHFAWSGWASIITHNISDKSSHNGDEVFHTQSDLSAAKGRGKRKTDHNHLPTDAWEHRMARSPSPGVSEPSRGTVCPFLSPFWRIWKPAAPCRAGP